MRLIRDIPSIYCDIIEDGLHKPNNDRLTVTELVNPPLIKHLQIEYWDEIETKASEYLWMLLGKAVHQVFESSGIMKRLREFEIFCKANKNTNRDDILFALDRIKKSHFAEKPIEIIVNGQLIRGRIDFRETGIIRDFKITSVWSFLGGIKPDWEKQLNIYDFMCAKNGIQINKLLVDAILRDWTKVKMYGNKDYPRMPFISLECPKWSTKEQYDYILSRIAAYNLEPSECTKEERWEKETTYAVKRPKGKRAIRVFNDVNEANNYIKGHKDSQKEPLEVEVRYGERTRCLHYCPVRTVCPFVKK